MVSRSSDNECSIGVKLLSEIIRAMSSAYMYFFDLACGRSAVYILKRRGASTDPREHHSSRICVCSSLRPGTAQSCVMKSYSL